MPPDQTLIITTTTEGTLTTYHSRGPPLLLIAKRLSFARNVQLDTLLFLHRVHRYLLIIFLSALF